MTDLIDHHQPILDCPFCGGEASGEGVVRYAASTVEEQDWGQSEFYYCNCTRCGACNRGLVGHRSRAKAIAAWNTRVPSSEVARLRKERDGWKRDYLTVLNLRLCGDDLHRALSAETEVARLKEQIEGLTKELAAEKKDNQCHIEQLDESDDLIKQHWETIQTRTKQRDEADRLGFERAREAAEKVLEDKAGHQLGRDRKIAFLDASDIVHAIPYAPAEKEESDAMRPKPQPGDCANRLKCGWHHVPTRPEINMWSCMEPRCPHAPHAQAQVQP